MVPTNTRANGISSLIIGKASILENTIEQQSLCKESFTSRELLWGENFYNCHLCIAGGRALYHSAVGVLRLCIIDYASLTLNLKVKKERRWQSNALLRSRGHGHKFDEQSNCDRKLKKQNSFFYTFAQTQPTHRLVITESMQLLQPSLQKVEYRCFQCLYRCLALPHTRTTMTFTGKVQGQRVPRV